MSGEQVRPGLLGEAYAQEVAYRLAEQVLEAFGVWAVGQPDGLLIWMDLEVVNEALGEAYQGSFHAAAGAALRLAGVAERGPHAQHLVPLFERLAEAWMLCGEVWREAEA